MVRNIQFHYENTFMYYTDLSVVVKNIVSRIVFNLSLFVLNT